MIKKKLIIVLVCVYTHANTQFSIDIEDLIEYKINSLGLKYKITSKLKKINYNKLKNPLFLLNKEKVISNSIFYSKGKFQSKDLNIIFEKAYFLEGKFIMINLKGSYLNEIFKAEKGSYFSNKLELKNVFLKKNKRKYKKLKYLINLKSIN